MPFTETLANEIKTTSIDQINRIRLKDPLGNTIFESKRVGILRMVNYIVTKIGKYEYAPGELTGTFQKVVPHIQSALPKKDLDTILASISAWIDSGGTIDIVKNSIKENS